ncbi:MAG: ABC transporter substrate-binding protein, partial [Candidatus Omnitrophota bacterium]
HTEAEDGFQAVLNEAFDVNWAELDAERSKEKLNEILKDIDPSVTDLVYTFSTPVAKIAKGVIKDIPVVFNVTYDPVRSEIVDSWERSGCNLVGGSVKVSAEGQINILRKIVDFKKLGIIYTPKESNSVICLKDLTALEKQFDFKAFPAEYNSEADVNSAIRVLDEAKVDAVIFAAGSTLAATAATVAKPLIERKLPSLSITKDMAKEGVLISLGVDYERLGREVGELAIRVLKGENTAEMKSIMLKNYDLVINQKTADQIGVKIPMTVLRMAKELIK